MSYIYRYYHKCDRVMEEYNTVMNDIAESNVDDEYQKCVPMYS